MAAAKGNCYNPKGPPVKSFDWELFEQLCGIQCTQEEIASMLKLDRNTLTIKVEDHYNVKDASKPQEDYSAIYKRFASDGKSSLRRYQFNMAKTNASMGIWLGKQWLGQKDHEAIEIAAKTEDLKMKEQLYQTLYQLAHLQKENNDLKSKANPELQRSDPPV